MESERIDWKAFAQQFRENHISQESFREFRYQEELNFFYRLLEDQGNEDYWKREHVGEYYTVFGALEEYWSFNAPIPPELGSLMILRMSSNSLERKEVVAGR